jgi:hypothetical protein
MNIFDSLTRAIDYVHSYAPDITEWIVLKKELLKTLSSEERSLFSIRDPITKKQRTNELEKLIAKLWTNKTNICLEMPNE